MWPTSAPRPKRDYAVQVRGPVVARLHHFTRQAVLPRQNASAPGRAGVLGRPMRARRTPCSSPATTNNTNDIERHYRVVLRAARSRVVIANAYFFPGYRFVREMRRAAERGVDVQLILQGQPTWAREDSGPLCTT